MTDLYQNRALLFSDLTVRYAGFGALADVEIRPYTDATVPLFRGLPVPLQDQVIAQLETCIRICEKILSEGRKLSDSRSLIWCAIREFSLRPSGDLFTFIESNDDIIEMHSNLGTQIFRNFNFFNLCNYSLEELYCRHWSVLFGRNDAVVEQEITQLMIDIFSGQRQVAFSANVRPHNVVELVSARQFELRLEIKLAAPLFFSNSSLVGASLVIESAKKIGVRFVDRSPAQLHD